jgi:hypothetical protein
MNRIGVLAISGLLLGTSGLTALSCASKALVGINEVLTFVNGYRYATANF